MADRRIEGTTPVWIRFWSDRRATTAIEYAIIGFFISVSIVAAATAIGRTVAEGYYVPTAKALS